MSLRISKHDLPLKPEKLAEIKDFCRIQIKAGNLWVLGQIPEVLRVDWLDKSLDETVRANQHTNVDPAVWRAALESMCSITVEAYLQECKRRETIALLMWRAALAYNSSLAACGIHQCHIDTKRDERTLKITEHMPLNEADRKTLCVLGRDGQVLIPDPMLASGSSMLFAIDTVKSFGIEDNQITVACVVAAPEGVFNLLNLHPDIKIITAVMDGCLNVNAYIVNPGLGDAGAKYFCGNTPDSFQKTRHTFTDRQWAYLIHLLEIANR